MRIISGKYKGHHLVSFQAQHLRPTMDRVRETLFNKWMGQIEEQSFLDLFSGTGSLGLEAISRGARHCTFVDRNLKSIQILKKNLEKLKTPSHQYEIYQQDVLGFLRQAKTEFDFIVIDPPFTEKMAHEVMGVLSASSCFHLQTQIAIESVHQERIDEKYAKLSRYDMKNYGDKNLSLFQVSYEDQSE